jgi:hypothetical protein
MNKAMFGIQLLSSRAEQRIRDANPLRSRGTLCLACPRNAIRRGAAWEHRKTQGPSTSLGMTKIITVWGDCRASLETLVERKRSYEYAAASQREAATPLRMTLLLFGTQPGGCGGQNAGVRRVRQRLLQGCTHQGKSFGRHQTLHALKQFAFFLANVGRQLLHQGL